MRRNRGRMATTLYLTAALWLMLVPAANAYIDSGSVSVMFQGIVAAIAAGGMFFKLFWRRLTEMFASRGTAATSSTQDEAPADAPVAADASGATDQ